MTANQHSRRSGNRLLALLLAAGLFSLASAAEIHDATRRGDLAAVRHLLDSKPQLVSARDAEGCTPLHLAAQSGHVPLVDLLLAQGADVNARTQHGVTPLLTAFLKTPTEIVPGLLARGADPNLRMDGGLSPLAAAAKRGDLALARLLLEKGAHVDAMHGSQETPLSVALAGGHQELAELLRQRGGLDPLRLVQTGDIGPLRAAVGRNPEWLRTSTLHGKMLLFEAVYEKQRAAVELLLEIEADVDGLSAALSPAVATGNLELTALLIQHGAKVDPPAPDGTTPLFSAARAGHAAIVGLLLEKGADPAVSHRVLRTTPLHVAVAGADTAVDPRKKEESMRVAAQNWVTSKPATPLASALLTEFDPKMEPASFTKMAERYMRGFAMGNGHREAARFLLVRGADREARDKLGRTPLGLAAAVKSLPMVELLLEHQANLEARDAAGMTPLNSAARAGSLPVVKALLARGAELEATDNAGFAPLQSAVESGSLEVVEELLARGAQVNRQVGDGRTALHSAATDGYADIVKLLLRHGATLDARERKGQNTPLMLAARYGHGGAFHALVAAGADFRSRGGNAWTVLHQAAVKDDLERTAPADNSVAAPKLGSDRAAIAEWLLAQGVDLEAKNGDGGTPLLLAAATGNFSVAELLVLKGANPNVPAKNGDTPLHFAALAGPARLIELLLQHGADAKAINGVSRNALHAAAQWRPATARTAPGAFVSPGQAEKIEIIKLLLAAGADPTAQSKDRLTPLDVALECGAKEIARFLMEASSRPPPSKPATQVEPADAETQYRLAGRYLNGEGVRKDASEAARWFRRAAEQGHALSQNCLGSLYADGTGVRRDTKAALDWLRKSAEQGNQDAMYKLGMMHAFETTPRNPAEGMKWFRRAADQGYAKGQYWVGELHYEGVGVAKDPAEALLWLRKAASQGNADALFRIGYMHEKGIGLVEDSAEAARFYLSAADQGHHVGSYRLGVMYSHGNGVPQDLVQAFAWLTFSAHVGNSAAKKLLPGLENKMTAEQKAKAATMAQGLIEKQQARRP